MSKTTDYVPAKSSRHRVVINAVYLVGVAWAAFYYYSQPAVKDACREAYDKGVQLDICDTLLLFPSENREFAQLRSKGRSSIDDESQIPVAALPDNIFDEK